MPNEFKLTIELIPSSSWNINLRSLLKREMWDNLRKSIYKKNNFKCAICGSRGKLHCHEEWVYDDKNHMQKLKDLVAVCYKCHQVKHIGLAALQSNKLGRDYEQIVRHFMKVNKCDRLTFQKHLKKAFNKYEERSRYEWSLDLKDYQSKISV